MKESVGIGWGYALRLLREVVLFCPQIAQMNTDLIYLGMKMKILALF